MEIAIIGAGSVGRALGQNWASKGHAVTYGVPVPSKEKYADLSGVMSSEQASAGAEIIVLATPWPATQGAIESLGDLQGKVLIDCTNPLTITENGLTLDRGHTTSGGETVAGWASTARVVKSLNQVGAEVMADVSGFAAPPVMFVAGDDADAKSTATALISDLGFDALDAGALDRARILEPFAMVWINQALLRGKGRDWAFGALPRTKTSTEAPHS